MQVMSKNGTNRWALSIVLIVMVVAMLLSGQCAVFAADDSLQDGTVLTDANTNEQANSVDMTELADNSAAAQANDEKGLIISAPQSIYIQFGDSYSVDDLADKKATFDGEEISGTWQLSDETLTEIGQYQVILTFTADNSKYGKAEQFVKVNILPGAAKKLPSGEPSFTPITEAGLTLADANLTIGTIGPIDGDIAFDDPAETVVEPNIVYRWTFTPKDDNYAPLRGEIMPFVQAVEETTQPVEETTTEQPVEENTEAQPVEQSTEDQPLTETPSSDEEYQGYFDVKTDAWYYNAVKYVAQRKIMQGVSDEMFLPDYDTTRGMLMAILHRLSGQPAPTKQDIFSDVWDGFWYTDPVNWGAEQGIANGVGDDMFMPNGELTREQLVAALYRYALLNDYDVSAEQELTVYDDLDALSDWATQPMRWAVSNKIITGTSETTLAPRAGATRAQMATILQRFMEKYVK